MRNGWYWMLDAGFWILDTRYWILGIGYWMVVGDPVFKRGYSLLVRFLAPCALGLMPVSSIQSPQHLISDPLYLLIFINLLSCKIPYIKSAGDFLIIAIDPGEPDV